MNGNRPLIGITPGYDYSKDMCYAKSGYYEAIGQVGGLPIIVPIIQDEAILNDVIERCQGFLLTGGPDIDASYFGEVNLQFNGEISPYRDYMEVFIAKKALERNKPVLGICRGMQVLNVAAGGTLYQDISSQVKSENLIKHSQEAPVWHPTHHVIMEEHSKVWQSFMKDRVRVNSFHHQAVKDVAPQFIASSRSEDGVVESIEHTNHIFSVGVQWHPELMWKKDPCFLKLFKDFVESC